MNTTTTRFETFGCQINPSMDGCFDGAERTPGQVGRALLDSFDGTVAYDATVSASALKTPKELYPAMSVALDAETRADAALAEVDRRGADYAGKGALGAHAVELGLEIAEVGHEVAAVAGPVGAVLEPLAAILHAQVARAEGKREAEKQHFMNGYAEGAADALYGTTHTPSGDGMDAKGYEAGRAYVASLSPEEREALKADMEDKWARQTGIGGQQPARDHVESGLRHWLNEKA